MGQRNKYTQYRSCWAGTESLLCSGSLIKLTTCLGLESRAHVMTRSRSAARQSNLESPPLAVWRSSLAAASIRSLSSCFASRCLDRSPSPPWLKPSAATHQNLNKTPLRLSFLVFFRKPRAPAGSAPIAMSRAHLLRRLLPFSPSAASFRSASSYSSRSASSRYASASTAAASAQAGAAGAAQSGAAAAEPLAGAAEHGASAPPPEARGRWGLLKYGILAAVSAALGGVGYVSYAYSLDEVDQNTRDFRKKLLTTVPEDASEFEKFKAMAMKVPVAAIELYLDVRSTIEDHVRGFTEPTSDKLLPDLLPEEKHVFTLVLDLNETLVYSDWQRERGWRTFKRPGVDAFLEHMSKCYELVVFSDQPPMYVDPVLDRLDTRNCIRYRLSRPATKYMDGKHFRDLSKLNRNPEQVIYISAHCYETCLQPENCVQVKPWKLENDDTQLVDLIPFLEFVALARPPDTRKVLASYQGCDVAKEFLERSKEQHRRREEQNKQAGRFFRR